MVCIWKSSPRYIYFWNSYLHLPQKWPSFVGKNHLPVPRYLYLLLVLPALLILNDCLASLRCSKRCAAAVRGAAGYVCRCRLPSSDVAAEGALVRHRETR